MKTTITPITIHDTAYGGYGVGRTPEGQVIMIPHTVTGDVVSAVMIEDKKSYLFGELVEVLTPSPLRAETPHCKYVGECGGCHFGHIAYQHQIVLKTRMVQNALRKHSDAETFPPLETFHSDPYRYRNRVTFRTANGEIGFFKGKTNDFIPVEDCPITKSSIVTKAEEFAKANPLNTLADLYIIENDEQVAIARLDSEEEREYVREPFDGLRVGARTFGLSHLPYQTAFGVVGAGYRSFFQGNARLIPRMQMEVAKEINRGERVLELYAGAGFFTCALADTGAEVVAVEVDQEAVELANQLGTAQINAVNVERFLTNRKERFDAVVVDPPRNGLSKNVITYLEKTKPAKVVYVSCNPTTMARDVIRLAGTYTVERLALLDMFPHTYHVETITVLSLRR